MPPIESPDQLLPSLKFRNCLEENYQNRQLIHKKLGSIIVLKKNQYWMVIRGMVKLESITMHGDQQLLGLVGPNEIFGNSLTKVLPYQVKALSDCDLQCFDGLEIESSPSLALAVLKGVSERHKQSEIFLSLFGLNLIEERIKEFLKSISKDYGQVSEDGIVINFRLTHQDLANALGTTRVTITRIMGLLKKQRFLRINSKKNIILL